LKELPLGKLKDHSPVYVYTFNNVCRQLVLRHSSINTATVKVEQNRKKIINASATRYIFVYKPHEKFVSDGNERFINSNGAKTQEMADAH